MHVPCWLQYVGHEYTDGPFAFNGIKFTIFEIQTTVMTIDYCFG